MLMPMFLDYSENLIFYFLLIFTVLLVSTFGHNFNLGNNKPLNKMRLQVTGTHRLLLSEMFKADKNGIKRKHENCIRCECIKKKYRNTEHRLKKLQANSFLNWLPPTIAGETQSGLCLILRFSPGYLLMWCVYRSTLKPPRLLPVVASPTFIKHV